MRGNPLFINHCPQYGIIQRIDFCHFMRGSKTIEKMHQRNTAFQGCGMGDQRKIHDFLRRIGTEHAKTGHTRRHDIAVIAKNRQALTSQRTGGNMKHRGVSSPAILYILGSLIIQISSQYCVAHKKLLLTYSAIDTLLQSSRLREMAHSGHSRTSRLRRTVS